MKATDSARLILACPISKLIAPRPLSSAKTAPTEGKALGVEVVRRRGCLYHRLGDFQGPITGFAYRFARLVSLPLPKKRTSTRTTNEQGSISPSLHGSSFDINSAPSLYTMKIANCY